MFKQGLFALSVLSTAAAMGLMPAEVQAQTRTWEYRVFTIEGGARAGTFRQAQVIGAKNYRVIVRCGRDGRPWMAVRFGDQPRWPGPDVQLKANIGGANGVEVYEIGQMSYSQNVYEAPLPPEMVPAMKSGQSMTLEGKNFHFDWDFTLSGSSEALDQLDCI